MKFEQPVNVVLDDGHLSVKSTIVDLDPFVKVWPLFDFGELFRRMTSKVVAVFAREEILREHFIGDRAHLNLGGTRTLVPRAGH